MAVRLTAAIVCLAANVGAFAPSCARSQRTQLFVTSEEDLKASILANEGNVEYNTLAGVEQATEIPAGISFEPPVVAKVMGKYDGEYELTVSDGEAQAGGSSIDVVVTPDSMSYEEYYAGFSDAPAWVTVSPNIGKLENKNGSPTTLTVTAAPPKGESFVGDVTLVCVLPDDIDKAYKIELKVGDGVETSAYDAGSDEELD